MILKLACDWGLRLFICFGKEFTINKESKYYEMPGGLMMSNNTIKI